jgi:hypothetical protein
VENCQQGNDKKFIVIMVCGGQTRLQSWDECNVGSNETKRQLKIYKIDYGDQDGWLIRIC